MLENAEDSVEDARVVSGPGRAIIVLRSPEGEVGLEIGWEDA